MKSPVLVLGAVSQGGASQPGGADDFAATWDKIAKAVRSGYYARDTRKTEMEQILAEFGPRAKAATSRAQFEDVILEMIRRFKDSHFDYLTRSDQGFYLMQGLANAKGAEEMPEIGAWFAKAEGGYQVRMVLDGGEAARVGLRKGDVATTIDGDPFTPVDSLRSRVGKDATLAVKRGAANVTFRVKPQSKPCLRMFLDASEDSARILDDHGRKIGYFHLWTQASDSFRSALSDAVYGKLRDTDAFILDLRDGFGGRPEGYGDPFFRPDFWVKWTSSPTSSYRQLFGYGRPLVVLINGGSRSAKEILSFAFKTSHRATLIGQTTAGNVLGTFPDKINDWSYLEEPRVDVSVQGIRLENRGVSPDVRLPQEIDDDGNDLFLQAALDRLKGVSIYKGDLYKPKEPAASPTDKIPAP